jgi:hypothetical protein
MSGELVLLYSLLQDAGAENLHLVLALRSTSPPQSKAGGMIVETTVDHALMRGLVTAGP